MKFTEIETKYSAREIKLRDYVDMTAGMGPKRTLDISGYDYYFVCKTDPESFIRYRASPIDPQLTMKRKTVEGNNNRRREVNLPISKDATLETVTAFCAELGYDYNFVIWKSCWIHWFETYNLVYYVVKDEEMRELDRFIEIEMDEHYDWRDEDHAWETLKKVEKLIAPLGISPQSRLRKSLFEMFRKTVRQPSTV